MTMRFLVEVVEEEVFTEVPRPDPLCTLEGVAVVVVVVAMALRHRLLIILTIIIMARRHPHPHDPSH